MNKYPRNSFKPVFASRVTLFLIVLNIVIYLFTSSKYESTYLIHRRLHKRLIALKEDNNSSVARLRDLIEYRNAIASKINSGDAEKEEWAELETYETKIKTVESTIDEIMLEKDSILYQVKDTLINAPTARFGFLSTYVKDEPWRLITYQFVHISHIHLIFNMIFLIFAGISLEFQWGSRNFLLFYLLTGIVSALFFAKVFNSGYSPLTGSSCSIAGIMGALAVGYPETPLNIRGLKLKNNINISFKVIHILIIWFLAQLILAIAGSYDGNTRVAYWGHVAGFIFGVSVIVSGRLLGIRRNAGFSGYRNDIVPSHRLNDLRRLIKEDDIHEAERVSDQLVLDFPCNLDVWIHRMQIMKMCINRSVDYIEALTMTIKTALEHNKPRTAVISFMENKEDFISSDTVGPGILLKLAEALYKNGYSRESFGIYSKLSDMYPDSNEIRAVEGRLMKILKKSAKSRRIMEEYLLSYPNVFLRELLEKLTL